MLLFRLLLWPQLNSIEGRRDPPDPLSGLGKGVNIQNQLSMVVVVIKYLQTSPNCQLWLSTTFTNKDKLSVVVVIKYLQTSPSCQWWLTTMFTNEDKLSTPFRHRKSPTTVSGGQQLGYLPVDTLPVVVINPIQTSQIRISCSGHWWLSSPSSLYR